MTTRVEVDFNSRDDAGRVPASLSEVEGPLRVGETVEAYDDDGNRCLVIVTSLSGRAIALDPVWRTFSSRDESRLVVTGAPFDLWADWRNRLTVSFVQATVTGPTPFTSNREASVA